jgi:hypothetical protein
VTTPVVLPDSANAERMNQVDAALTRLWGAVEVGMLRALFRAGYRPDLVVGTSGGAVNGALVAA